MRVCSQLVKGVVSSRNENTKDVGLEHSAADAA